MRPSRFFPSAPAFAFGLAFSLALGLDASSAHAQSYDDKEKARAEYDQGRQAYRDRRYSEAGSHFEAAFAALPSSQALRNSIRARREAQELDRAATLAALAEKMYAADSPTMVLVREVIAEASPRLTRVDVTCSPACVLRVDGAPSSSGDNPQDQHRIFIKPGSRGIEARFSGQGSQATSIDAKAGAREEWKAEPEGDGKGGKDKDGKEGKGGKDDKGSKNVEPPSEADTRPFSKGVFYGGVVASTLMAGLSVGSYIDLKRVEGEELKVTEECAADPAADADCFPTGEVSKSARRRTYIVAGVTGAMIITTAVVGLYFTRWTSKDPVSAKSGQTRLDPYVVPLRQGAAFGLSGAF